MVGIQYRGLQTGMDVLHEVGVVLDRRRGGQRRDEHLVGVWVVERRSSGNARPAVQRLSEADPGIVGRVVVEGPGRRMARTS